MRTLSGCPLGKSWQPSNNLNSSKGLRQYRSTSVEGHYLEENYNRKVPPAPPVACRIFFSLGGDRGAMCKVPFFDISSKKTCQTTLGFGAKSRCCLMWNPHQNMYPSVEVTMLSLKIWLEKLHWILKLLHCGVRRHGVWQWQLTHDFRVFHSPRKGNGFRVSIAQVQRCQYFHLMRIQEIPMNTRVDVRSLFQA